MYPPAPLPRPFPTAAPAALPCPARRRLSRAVRGTRARQRDRRGHQRPFAGRRGADFCHKSPSNAHYREFRAHSEHPPAADARLTAPPAANTALLRQRRLTAARRPSRPSAARPPSCVWRRAAPCLRAMRARRGEMSGACAARPAGGGGGRIERPGLRYGRGGGRGAGRGGCSGGSSPHGARCGSPACLLWEAASLISSFSYVCGWLAAIAAILCPNPCSYYSFRVTSK